jgi:hypothetical protein
MRVADGGRLRLPGNVSRPVASLQPGGSKQAQAKGKATSGDEFFRRAALRS